MLLIFFAKIKTTNTLQLSLVFILFIIFIIAEKFIFMLTVLLRHNQLIFSSILHTKNYKIYQFFGHKKYTMVVLFDCLFVN